MQGYHSSKAIFARHGIPVVLMSDNGPQFIWKEMEEFAEVKHVTNSPLYPQSNGLAERFVMGQSKSC